MEIKMSSETNKKPEVKKKICISCKNDLPLILDKFICPYCGIKNK